jgi:hypothetical protein
MASDDVRSRVFDLRAFDGVQAANIFADETLAAFVDTHVRITIEADDAPDYRQARGVVSPRPGYDAAEIPADAGTHRRMRDEQPPHDGGDDGH